MLEYRHQNLRGKSFIQGRRNRKGGGGGAGPALPDLNTELKNIFFLNVFSA